MTYHADLGTESMIATGAQIRAVGLLEPDHAFPVGDTSDRFRSHLIEMSNN